MDEILERAVAMQLLRLIGTTHSAVIGSKAKDGRRNGINQTALDKRFVAGETAFIKITKGTLDALDAMGKLPAGWGVTYSLIKSLDAINTANAKAPIRRRDNPVDATIIAEIKGLKALGDYLKAKDMLHGNLGKVFKHLKVIDAYATIYDNVHKIISNTEKGNHNVLFSDIKASIKIARAVGTIAEVMGVEFTGSLAELYRATKIIDGIGTLGDGILGMFGQSAMADGAVAVASELSAGAATLGGIEAAIAGIALADVGLVGGLTYAALKGEGEKETEAEAIKRQQSQLKSPILFWSSATGKPVTSADIEYLENAKRTGKTSNPKYMYLNTVIEQQGPMLKQVTQPFIAPMLFNGSPLSLFPRVFNTGDKTAVHDRISLKQPSKKSDQFQKYQQLPGTTININTPLIGTFNIPTKNMNESYDNVKQEILQVLLEVFNRAAPAH